jgi:hypothetical protein
MKTSFIRLGLLFCVAAGFACAKTTDQDFGTIFVSKYYLNNNVWGKQHSPGYASSIWNVNDKSPLSWGTKYTVPEGGYPYKVKSYLSVICGWHWGTHSKNSGLPVQLAEKRPVLSSASCTIKNPGVQNIAYDLWFHELRNPGNKDNPTDELMIWVAAYRGAGPLGTKQGTVTIAGAEWDLYKGNVGWEVYSFVRKGNTSEWSFNLDDFIEHVVNVRKWMNEKKYLTSVQFGTEVFSTNGEGQLDIANFRVDVQDKASSK